MALAGNLPTMFRLVSGLSFDFKILGTIGSPSILVERFSLSGA
jgi:predicted Zn-dependent protease